MTAQTEDTNVVLYTFSNAGEAPYLDTLLSMFYEGVYGNTVGIMQGWNLDKEEEETILVGVQLDEDGKPDLYPIASIIKAEDVPRYLAPNGKGGFYDPSDAVENAEAKDAMLNFEDALVQEEVSE